MPPPVDRFMGATQLLTVRAGARAWALPSVAITRVERVSEEPTDAPDASSLLGMEPSGAEHGRCVLVLRAQGEEQRVSVRGSLDVTVAQAGELLPLPRELAAVAPLVTHIALVAGKPALFVVSPERLLGASRRSNGPFTLPDTDVARGSSC